MAVERGRRSRGGAMIHGGLLLEFMMMTMIRAMMLPAGVWASEAEVKSNLTVIEMKVQNLYPESFDWDAKHNRFLVGSTSQGRLVTVTEEGVVEDFVKDEDYAGAGAMILGVTVDSARNRVLAVVHKTMDRPHGRPMDVVVAYDLDSKKRTLFVKLMEEEEDGSVSGSKNFVANDVAVDGDGNAYVTNSRGYSIWKVTPEGGKSVFIDSVPQLPIAVEVEFQKMVTLNGIVHYDGYILFSQTNSGALFRVKLADKEVRAVKIKDGTVMPGADGMALRPDGSLVVVSMHTAYLLSSRDSWGSATVLDKVLLDAADFSSSATVVNESRVFTIHQHYFESLKGVTLDSFKILEIDFPSDSHDSPLWLLVIVGIFAALVLAWKFQLSRFNKEYNKKRV
ncbi:unnamed protein product [Calypogeia fissa]